MANGEFKKGLEARTILFSVRLLNYLSALPNKKVFWLIIDQLGRSGTSIGANYREANRAESKADFVHKIGIVEKECSETVYWLTVMTCISLLEVSFLPEAKALLSEANELLALFSTIKRRSKNDAEVGVSRQSLSTL